LPHTHWSSASALVDAVADLLVGAALFITVAVIFCQVVLRYLLASPSIWLDEFAVLVFAWMIFLGAAIAQRTDSHIAMGTLVALLPAPVQRALYALRCGAMATVLGVLFWQGLLLTMRLRSVEYPAMGISRGFLYIALPATVPLFLFYLGRGLRRRWRRRAEHESWWTGGETL
jgi:TRAP-type C4-dicarboxylate transport system permease small subunit